MTTWFRWYDGTSRDGKFQIVARNADVTVAEVLGVWAIILEDAAHDDHRGVATKGLNYYATILDYHEENIRRIVAGMASLEVVDIDGETITVRNWRKRQYEDRTNAERQRRYRNAHKSKRNAVRNAQVTHPETETETETEKEKKESCRLTPTAPAKKKISYSEAFDRFWSAYPKSKNMSKFEAWAEWQKLSAEDHEAAVGAIPGYIAYLKTKPDLETIHACRFLKKRRFEGFAGAAAAPRSSEEVWAMIAAGGPKQ